MNPDASPFRPGRTVPAELFVGREKEITQLRGMVRASMRGNYQIGFVSGERGIGKSSLVSFVRHICERQDNVAGSHVFLGGVHDLPEMIRTTFDQTLKESIEKPWYQQMLSFFGNRVKEVGLFGVSVKLQLSDDDVSTITRNFVPSIRQLIQSLPDDKQGLVLILDDINGIASSPTFANWFKSMIDEIGVSEKPIPICIVFVGLEERRYELIRQQPSIARIFTLVDIKPWSDDEVRTFYQQSFASASASIADSGMDMMVQFTGGLPVLAHEIGDAVWRVAREMAIQGGEVMAGIVMAADTVGAKYLQPQVMQALRSERYHAILRKIAERILLGQSSFRRADLQARLTDDERKVLDSFLRRMRELGVIVVDSEVRGGYRFVNHLHALYFRMEAQRAKQENN